VARRDPTLWEWLNSEGGRPPRCIRALTPTYDELSLFLMSAAFLLLLLTNTVLRKEAHRLLVRDFDLRYAIVIAFSSCGIVLSIYHVLTRRPKSKGQKFLMLFFAIYVNALAALAAGIHLFKQSKGWAFVFPLWNIANGLWLLFLFRCEAIDESHISDEHARPLETFVGAGVLIGLFALCQYVWDCYWAITFSVCVGHATPFGRLIPRLMRRRCVEHGGARAEHESNGSPAT